MFFIQDKSDTYHIVATLCRSIAATYLFCFGIDVARQYDDDNLLMLFSIQFFAMFRLVYEDYKIVASRHSTRKLAAAWVVMSFGIPYGWWILVKQTEMEEGNNYIFFTVGTFYTLALITNIFCVIKATRVDSSREDYVKTKPSPQYKAYTRLDEKDSRIVC